MVRFSFMLRSLLSPTDAINYTNRKTDLDFDISEYFKNLCSISRKNNFKMLGNGEQLGVVPILDIVVPNFDDNPNKLYRFIKLGHYNDFNNPVNLKSSERDSMHRRLYLQNFGDQRRNLPN